MSVYTTDTHCLIWYSTGDNRKLSRRALRAFQAAERGEAFIYVPAVVLWEISRLEKESEIELRMGYEGWVGALLAHPCFECVPLDEAVIAQARTYSFNRDIFDAAIVATAVLKDVPLITRDVEITDSDAVQVFW